MSTSQRCTRGACSRPADIEVGGDPVCLGCADARDDAALKRFVEAAHEDGLDVGQTRVGQRLHAVEFDVGTVLARARGAPDRLACGAIKDCRRVDDLEEVDGVCTSCEVSLGLRSRMELVTDGGRSDSEVEQFDTADALAMVRGHAEIYADMEAPDAY